MILSHMHKFVFICNGRTGTTSIQTALDPFHEGGEYQMGVNAFSR